MYASSLILEKVTVAPPTRKGTELKHRKVVLTAAQIPTEDETTVTTPKTNSDADKRPNVDRDETLLLLPPPPPLPT